MPYPVEIVERAEEFGDQIALGSRPGRRSLAGLALAEVVELGLEPKQPVSEAPDLLELLFQIPFDRLGGDRRLVGVLAPCGRSLFPLHLSAGSRVILGALDGNFARVVGSHHEMANIDIRSPESSPARAHPSAESPPGPDGE